MESTIKDGHVMVEVDIPPAKRSKTATGTTAARTCQFCTNKKQVAANCVSVACKKCCLMRSQACVIHPKEEEKLDPEPSRLKKRVLKNEFQEPNFHYYGETVTIFCVRDFFEMKKLCQSVLKDQERTQRVSGNAWSRRKKKNAAKSKLKELIQCALGKIPAPVGYGEVEARDQIAAADT